MRRRKTAIAGDVFGVCQTRPNMSGLEVNDIDPIEELRGNLGSALGQGNLSGLVGRPRIVDALISVAVFCKRVQDLAIYSDQFNELASVFADLDHGTIHPILSPRNRGNRPPEPTDLWCARARVAVAVALLIESGRTIRAAAGFVATEFPGLKVLQQAGTRRKELSASVTHWHNEFAKGKIQNTEAREMYDTVVLTLRSQIETKLMTNKRIEGLARRHLAKTSEFVPMAKEAVVGSRKRGSKTR
jgi:hypothetical protein